MPTYYDSRNKPYDLAEQIGRGGEGEVFSCADDSGLVAKIYHEPVSEEKAGKLRWMAENKNEHLLKVAAWVIDVLYDKPDGEIVGFLMPNVHAKEIHELYSLKSRRIYFPEATWHFLVHTAANLARAFFSLHRDQHIMGDINHGNCVVLADGRVKLIDCDSYSIRRENFRYRCDVGVATHLAPELQGKDLAKIEREAAHDNFGLAVIIFQLLFLGRHPFSGNYLGAEDKSLEDCIREKRFAYGDNTDITKVEQPPGTLSLREVSPRLAAMFERAFLINDRPEPREWVEALEDFSRSLKQCGFHPGHHFYEKLAACPWCRIEGQTGLMLFPFITSPDDLAGEKPFNIFTIENLIENLGIKQNLPVKPPDLSISVPPPPSPDFIEKRKEKDKKQINTIIIQFVLILVFMIFLGIGAGVFVGVVTMIFFVISLNNPDKNLRSELNERLFDVREKWNQIEQEWSKTAVPQKVDEDLTQIRKKIDVYQNLQIEAKKNSASAQTVQDENLSIRETSGKRRMIEKEIEQLFASLRSASVHLRRHQERLLTQSELISKEILQAESDVRALGNSSAAIVALILVTFITPFAGSIIVGNSSTNINSTAYSNPYPATSESRTIGKIAEPVSLELPDEDISDFEISILSESKRKEYAENLFSQAQKSIAVPGKADYYEAEEKLRFALRFNKKDTAVLNLLGYVLYERKEYSVALVFLNRSLEIDKANSGTKLLIGMNYLEMTKLSEAISIFKKVIESNPNSSEAFYNLGLAYKGVKNYQLATESLRRAVELNPNDVNSHYELGFCLYKTGDTESTWDQYRLLLELKEESLANKLFDEADLGQGIKRGNYTTTGVPVR